VKQGKARLSFECLLQHQKSKDCKAKYLGVYIVNLDSAKPSTHFLYKTNCSFLIKYHSSHIHHCVVVCPLCGRWVVCLPPIHSKFTVQPLNESQSIPWWTLMHPRLSFRSSHTLVHHHLPNQAAVIPATMPSQTFNPSMIMSKNPLPKPCHKIAIAKKQLCDECLRVSLSDQLLT
jgi:hypothetical protein